MARPCVPRKILLRATQWETLSLVLSSRAWPLWTQVLWTRTPPEGQLWSLKASVWKLYMTLR